MRSSVDKNIPANLLSGGAEIGDVRYFVSNPGPPWLPADALDYAQSLYPALYVKLGHRHAEGYKGYPTRTVGMPYNGGSNPLLSQVGGGNIVQPRLIAHHYNVGAGSALQTRISDDGGKTWVAGGTIPGNASYTSYYHNATYFPHLNAWIVSAWHDTGSYNYVWRKHISYDNGASWGAAITGYTGRRDDSGSPVETHNIAYTGQNLIHCGMSDYSSNRRIEKSTDGGATWSAVLTEAGGSSAAFRSVASDGAGRVVVTRGGAGTGTIARVSTDHGNTFGADGTAIGGYTGSGGILPVLFAVGKFWVVTQFNLVFNSLDGVTWSHVSTLPPGKLYNRTPRAWWWNGERFLVSHAADTDSGAVVSFSMDGIHWGRLQFNNTTGEGDRYITSPAWVPGMGRVGGLLWSVYDWVYFEDPVIAANKFRVPLLTPGHYIRAA